MHAAGNGKHFGLPRPRHVCVDVDDVDRHGGAVRNAICNPIDYDERATGKDDVDDGGGSDEESMTRTKVGRTDNNVSTGKSEREKRYRTTGWRRLTTRVRVRYLYIFIYICAE